MSLVLRFLMLHSDLPLQAIGVEHDGERYIWTGQAWCHATRKTGPPLAIVARLNTLAMADLLEQDEKITGYEELMARAMVAGRENVKQYARAERILERILARHPGDEPALAVLSSMYRQQRLPEKALQACARVPQPRSSALLTSKAAALCDLERWEEARATLRAVAGWRAGDPTSLVLARIKKARPDLF